jgi:hypothetical protein
MPLTLVATPQPGNAPPRVRLDIAGGTGPVTVWRLDPDGRQRRVRTADDGPQPLTSGAATLYDPEAPYGQRVSYSTDAPGSPAVTVTLDVADVWLIHPGVPSRSVRLPVVTDLGEETEPTQAGAHQVLQRAKPVVINGGPRTAVASTLGIRTHTDAERLALRLLLADGAPLLLNVPTSLGWGVEAGYIAAGELRRARTLEFGYFPWREWSLPYQVVDRPTGGTRIGLPWSDVGAQYTWATLAAAVDSWAELAAPDPNVTAVYPGASTFPAADLYPGG